MTAIRFLLGIVGVLVALFAGGCSLLLFVSMSGSADDLALMGDLLPGVVLAVLGGLIAWGAFRKRPDVDGTLPPSEEGGP
jgi:hypothetical protein